MANRLLFGLLLLCLVVAGSGEKPKDRMRMMNKEVEAILTSAKVDQDGKVTVEEYGRLLAAVLKAKEVHRRILNVLTLAKKYVATLSGPQDPSKVLQDLNSGPFWEMMQAELHKGPEKKRPIKQDL